MDRTKPDETPMLLSNVLAQLPSAIAVVDVARRRVLMSNPAAEALLGAGAQVLLDPPEGHPAAEARAAIEAALAAGGPITSDKAIVDGERAYRAKAAPVRDATGEIIAAAVVLEDITSELRAREAAERASRTDEEMLAIVSHDLRGPLSSIHVAADGLRELDLGPSDRDRYLDAIQRSVQRADRLIRDLQDASQIEAGRLKVEPRSIRVRDVLDQAVRENELVATQAGAKLVVDVAPGVDRVTADRDRLLQALANLIQNALRHGKPTPKVELSAQPTEGGIELAVRDHGPGIPDDAAPHVFDRHWQGRKKRGGAGLGLAIVRGIVAAHGGRCTAGTAPGGGARISIVLPATIVLGSS